MSGPRTAGTSDTAETPTGVVPPTGGGRSGFLSDVIVELRLAQGRIRGALRALAEPGAPDAT